MPVRKIFFWMHLAAGLAIGIVILSMSVTGMMMAFEPQITEWSERHVRFLEGPIPASARLSLDTLLAAARQELPGANPTDIRVGSDASATVAVGFGKEKRSVFLDPYSGKALGKDSRAHVFLSQVEQWHRWLGAKRIWKPVIDAVSLCFAFMILSGWYLWCPRRWTRAALRAVSLPNLKLSGKARDWNWHNSIGLWAAPFLLVIAMTGSVIGYRWANDLVFVLTGSPIPPKPKEESAGGKNRGGARMAEGERPAERTERTEKMERAVETPVQSPIEKASLDSLLDKAEGFVPGWESLSLRLPQKPGAPVTVSIQEPGLFKRNARSQVSLDAATGEVLKWEPYSGQTLGRKVRSWVVPVHTGRALGIAGQGVAATSACAAGFLVWTGMAMAWRRFSKRGGPSPE